MASWARRFVLLLFAIGLTACSGGEAETVDGCQCPNTEAIVVSIDWLGDGTTTNARESTRFGDEGTPQVQVRFSAFDDPSEPTAALGRLVERLASARFDTTVTDSTAQIRSDTFWVTASASEPFSGTTNLTIVVRVPVPDDQAPSALQPVVDALGTVN